MKNWILATFFGLSAISANAATVWFPLPAEAYRFNEVYPEAQRLLFAFDYGHALIYEKLLTVRGSAVDTARVEADLLAQILSILKNPPPVKIDEDDAAPFYAGTLPLALQIFDWSHYLHQFIYDVLSTVPDGDGRANAIVTRINELEAIYSANRSIALPATCKSMQFMDSQYFSKSFRRSYMGLNLLLWSYHWFQVRLYEALLQPTRAARDLAVTKTVADFRALVSDLPDSADFDMMPLTSKVAPTFARLFPRITAEFDNVHMFHDVISDVLVSPKVTDIRAQGLIEARMAQDPKAYGANICGE